MSEQFLNPELRPEISFLTPEETDDLAMRAYLAPESLDGAERHTLNKTNTAVTLDPNLLEPMGHNGPLAILELGEEYKRTVKLYGTQQEGGWAFTLTPGNFSNDDVDDHARNLSMVQLEGSKFIGRGEYLPGKGERTPGKALGIADDGMVSRSHFVVEPESDQFRVVDISTHGTKITFIEKPRPKFKEAYHKAYQARKLGGIVVPKQG